MWFPAAFPTPSRSLRSWATTASRSWFGAEKASQDATRLAALVDKYEQPVLAVHAPTLLVTRGVFGVDPWDKVDRSIELAHYLKAPTVVLHRPSSGRPVTRGPSSPGVGAA